ncbi:MAG: histidine kinase [Bacteroidetes bacterium]|uniref:Histidine kinase n=1 Tax=Candidatus Merdivivens pullicola TaxID=2840872 RepID=A0A9D9NGC9_9BACT|nr:histidine kinase [Candidatus Merdivivens pullicola]
MEGSRTHSKVPGAVIHIIVWALFFALPLFFMWNRSWESMDWGRFLRHCVNLLVLCSAFYLNYFILIPRLLFKGSKHKFVLANVCMATVFSTAMMLWQMHSFVPDAPGPRFRINPVLFSFARDFVSIFIMICLSALVKMSVRWQKAENARREAEKSRSEAELKNLRNQLNPHFLLNTLNNIYALISIDTEKAQEAVSELSRLLRYVLYDNNQHTVPLCKEMDFIKDYIYLMKIRVSQNVSVETDIRVSPDSLTPVAPLIFISLIENAFKHGISPVEQSRIRIFFDETPECVVCDIRNSFHPKSHSDKSGSGIGLEQVGKRLELLYSGHYFWNKGVSEDGKEYFSHLELMKNG